MNEKEFKQKTKELSDQVTSEITDNVTKQIKKDLDFDTLMSKVNEIAENNKSLVEKMAKSNVYKIFTSEDAQKDIEEADQKELAQAFGYAVFRKDIEAVKAISQKAFNLLPESQKRTLSEGTDTDGGYLVPNEFYNQLVVERENDLQLRNEVTVWQMRRLTIEIPKHNEDVRVTWGTENTAKTTTTLTFTQPTMTAYKLVAILRSSDELLDDAVVNMQQVIIQRFARAMKEAEEKAILIGTGSGQPTGLFVDANIGTTASTSFGFDELKSLYYSVPVQYRGPGKWIVPDTQMAKIDKFKDGNNRYLLQDSVADGSPMRMMGKELIVVPDEYMTGKTDQIMFGDLKEAYVLGDRHQMRVKISQDETESFTKDKTAFRVVQRLGGLVLKPKAVKKLISIS